MASGLAWIFLWSYLGVFIVSAVAMALSRDPIVPLVDLGYAWYQGSFDAQTNITSFLSIRYAAPPVGDLRFQAPQAPVLESAIQDATQNPSKCYQTGPGRNTSPLVTPHGQGRRQGIMPTASEDCLFLNVFVPGMIPTELVAKVGLPVLVWIHGGGYESGSAAEYNGADLVADSLNTVLVVVIQYRLGVFGFLSGNKIKAHGALNAGLLDQHLALQWVQEHIGLFGGDKNHVTIWGESAGAGSVVQHIVAHGGNTQPPLFNAAITSSTFMPSQYNFDDPVPQLLYNQVVNMTGCTSSADTFTCLQSVDAKTLETANFRIAKSAFYGTRVFVPVVDGTFIVERPTITLSGGQVNGRALLAISNVNEGYIHVNINQTSTVTDYVSQLFPEMTSHQAQQAVSVYEGYGTAVEQAIMVMGDSIFVCPTYYLLKTFANHSWKGLFAILPGYHAQDISYYFNSPINSPPYEHRKPFFESIMSFAKYYDVNTKFDPTDITPRWDTYAVGRSEMLFNRTEAGEAVTVPFRTDTRLLQRCAFWSSVTAETGQ